MLSTKLKAAAGNSADATLYVDDVFSTWLYTGNNSTQTITNGIDLAGKGGMTWIKARNDGTSGNVINDTNRGANNFLQTNSTVGNVNLTTLLTSFNSNGFSVGIDLSNSGINYASWSFRKAAKFFDVVTYTGTGSARTIAHSLGVAPGMVIVKRTDASANWQVYSNGLTSAAYSMQLNLFAAQASAPTVWNSTAPTSSVFSVGTDATVNASGGTYVAYLYAHDTSSTGIIQCGSYVGTGSTGKTVDLGWEPQFLLVKSVSVDDGYGWFLLDSMRGIPNSFASDGSAFLYANRAVGENNLAILCPTATGFYINSAGDPLNRNATTYIYMAIRRPNKPPTSGTQVYQGTTYSGNTTTITGTQLITTNLPVDLSIIQDRSNGNGTAFVDRLRGSMVRLQSAVTNADVANSGAYKMDYQNNFLLGDYNWNYTGRNYVNHAFKRALGFFDEVCYTGNGTSGTAITHNLGAIPELVIVKSRSAVTNWPVCCNISSTANTIYLNLTNEANVQTTRFPSLPTSTTFVIGNDNSVNTNAATYVAYLFATLAGISKVGSYTGNGSTGQAIACGFSAGARFVLIKRTDAAGAWYTFDSARGLTVGSSPYLLLNSTAAEVTGNNGVYASTGGFTLGSTASTTTNINAATYIFLAVA